MISILKNKNSGLEIKEITQESFEKYGRLLPSEFYQKAFEFLRTLKIPVHGNQYIAHDPLFKDYVGDKGTYNDVFGYSPIQFGYVNGKNSKLNALEYHKSSEINICESPLVLMVGHKQDIVNNIYDSSKLEVFYIPAQTVIELNPGVLHFSPCRVTEEGFKCGVILPMKTNVEFVSASAVNSLEDKLLFKTNKWLLAHEENETLIAKGAYPGLKGINYEIKY